MHPCRIFLLYIFLFLAIIGFFFSSFFLFVNIGEIYYYMSNNDIGYNFIITGFMKKISIDLSAVTSFILAIINFLRKISIDLSAVTPLILLWYCCIFCSSILRILSSYSSFAKRVNNTLRIYREKIILENIEHDPLFPFPSHFKTTWIQLGFIGTLWGFLMIGWQLKETSTFGSEDFIVDILLKSYGTSLLSTFTAVFMVYIFVPVSIKCFRFFIGVPFEPISNPVNQVTEQLIRLSKELKESAKIINSTNRNLTSWNSHLVHLDKVPGLIGQISGNLDQVNKSISNIHSDSQKILEGQQKGLSLFTQLSNTQEKHLKMMELFEINFINLPIKQINKALTEQNVQSKKIVKEISKINTELDNKIYKAKNDIKQYIDDLFKASFHHIDNSFKNLFNYIEKFHSDTTQNSTSNLLYENNNSKNYEEKLTVYKKFQNYLRKKRESFKK